MAKPKPGAQKPPVTGKPDAELLDEVFDARALNPALEALYGELGIGPDGQDTTVFVSYFLPDGKEARVWDGAPDDYNLMDTARKHGSGDYRVKLYGRVESGHKVPITGANKVFSIRLTAEEDARIKHARENPPLQPASGVAGGVSMTPEQIRLMIVEGIRAAIPAPVQTPVLNPLDIVRAVGDIFKSVQPAPNAASAFPVGELMRGVFGIMKEAGAARGNNEDDDRRPSRGSNIYDIWGRVVDKAIPLLETLAQRGTLGAPMPQANVNPAGAPTLTLVPGAASNNVNANTNAAHAGAETAHFAGTPEELAAMNAMKTGIAYLVAQADAGHDPVTYADVVQDNVPEESLRALIAQPDVVAYLSALDPRVANHKDWFVELFNTIKEDLTGDDTPPPPAA